MENLIAFHGKQSIKDKLLAQLQAHYEADEIIKGIYWENGKGCAVGCTVLRIYQMIYQILMLLLIMLLLILLILLILLLMLYQRTK